MSSEPGGVLHQPLANWEETAGANTAELTVEELTVEELVCEAKQALSASVVLAGDGLKRSLSVIRQRVAGVAEVAMYDTQERASLLTFQ